MKNILIQVGSEPSKNEKATKGMNHFVNVFVNGEFSFDHSLEYYDTPWNARRGAKNVQNRIGGKIQHV